MDFISQIFVRLQNDSQLVTNFVIFLLALNVVLMLIFLNKKRKFSAIIKVALFFVLLALIFSTRLGRVYWLNGWGWHDWFLIINIGLLIISTFLLLVKKRVYIAIINFFYALIVFPFIMVIFFAVGRTVTIDPSYFHSVWFLDQQSQIFVQQIEKKVVEGVSRGITSVSTTDLVVAIDSRSGQFKWSKPLERFEYLVGKLNNDVLMVNRDDRKIYLLDYETGKVKQTEKEFENTYPLLKGHFSYQYSDYLLVSPTEWYMHGADDKYYHIDEKTKTTTENPDYRKKFDKDFFKRGNVSKLTQQVTLQLKHKFPQMLDVNIVDMTEDQKPLVIFKNRLDDIDYQLAKVDLTQSEIIWQKDMSGDNDNNDYEMSRNVLRVYGRNEKQQIILSYKGYLFAIEEATGKTIYRYNFKWNQIEKGSFLF
ncbi:outer membrane protein assembly factor BamB [Erwinia toletana]|uniref:Outer membrane protein assembly factor BamB n=1 Tax=Winslowiella toletana TaxID=92490 RepID=A0ABS4P7Y7_9GAMM|nr:PA2928 family protein [Winslowiella toletana]MBP2168755.1 outer membrane protein assembly factor BamB [Winslowiella toletana]